MKQMICSIGKIVVFHSGGAVCAESWDRKGLERLLRYCARPPFASENLKTYRDKVVYTPSKQTLSSIGFVQLTPIEFIERLEQVDA